MDILIFDKIRKGVSIAKIKTETFAQERGKLLRKIRALEGYRDSSDDRDDRDDRYDRDDRDDRYERHDDHDDYNDNSIEISAGWAITTIIIYGVVTLIMGATAAYLSWSSNTLVRWHWVMKLFFAFFSFMFGLSYVITYLVMKLDLVLFLKYNLSSVIPPSSSSPAPAPTPVRSNA